MPVQQGYYDAEFAPWAAGMRRIGTMIAAQPQMQANAQTRQQQAGLLAARTATAGAQARNLDARTSETLRKGQLVEALQRSSQQAQQDLAAGVTDSPAVREFTGAASALTGVNKDDIADNMKKGIGTILARQGKVGEAAAVENPMQADRTIQQGQRLMPVQPGGAVYDPKQRKAVFNNPSAASQAQGEYEETSTTYPAVEGTPEVPAQPATKGIFGFGARPEVPGKPAIPAQPARTVKTRRKLGDMASAPLASQAQDPNDSEDATDPGGGEEQGEPAANPEGKKDFWSPQDRVPVVSDFLHGEAPPMGQQKLTPEIARVYLKKYGNRADAEKAAQQDGYSW